MSMGIFEVLGVVVMAILMFLGTPVPVALGIGGIAGLFGLAGDGAFTIAAKVVFDTLNDFVLLAVPLFILMGEVLSKGGVGEKMFKLFDAFLRQIPGGVGIATVLTCAVLSAMCGTSVAVAAMVGAFAIPSLTKYGYTFPLALGICVGGGALGILIPPSVPLIGYSSITQESAGKLFMAGIVPGILAVIIFCIYVAVTFWRNPERKVAPKATRHEKWVAFKEGIWALIIPVGIMIPLYVGIATPTEIAAIGVVWSLFVGLVIYRTMKPKDILPILRSSLNGIAMITFIICGAILFGNAVTQLGLGQQISDFFLSHGFPPWVFVLLTMILVLIMGCFLEGASILLILVPILLPSLLAYKINLIWFAVLLVINIEIGLMTPPVGLNLFAVDGVAKKLGLPSNMSIVIKGSWPFMVLYLLLMVIVGFVPQLALWIPGNMIK